MQDVCISSLREMTVNSLLTLPTAQRKVGILTSRIWEITIILDQITARKSKRDSTKSRDKIIVDPPKAFYFKP